jgi:hypothetical protein
VPPAVPSAVSAAPVVAAPTLAKMTAEANMSATDSMMEIIGVAVRKLRENNYVEQDAMVYNTIGSGLMQNMKLYGSLRNPMETFEVMEDLLYIVLDTVQGINVRDTLGNDAYDDLTFRKALNVVLLLWDAKLAKADAPHTVYAEDTGIHWYSITDEAWRVRYGKYSGFKPAGRGIFHKLRVLTLETCANLFYNHFKYVDGKVDNLSLLAACLRLYMWEHARLWACTKESEKAHFLAGLGHAGNELLQIVVKVLHNMAESYRAAGHVASKTEDPAKLPTIFCTIAHEALRMIQWCGSGNDQGFAIGQTLAMLRDDMLVFRTMPWFGTLATNFVTIAHSLEVPSSDEHIIGILRNPTVKTKDVARILRLHASALVLGFGPEPAGAGSGGSGSGAASDASATLPEDDSLEECFDDEFAATPPQSPSAQPATITDAVQNVLETRGAAILPAVLKWVRETGNCTPALYGVITRALRNLFETWNADGSAYDSALLRIVVRFYDELALRPEVYAVWMHAKDVIAWARFRVENDAAGIMPDPLRTFVRNAPRATLEAINVDKMRAEHWTLVDFCSAFFNSLS